MRSLSLLPLCLLMGSMLSAELTSASQLNFRHMATNNDNDAVAAAASAAGNTVGRDGHAIVIIEEDVLDFSSNTLYEVSIGATVHRVAFSDKHMLVEDPNPLPLRTGAANASSEEEEEEEDRMLICRLPTLNISKSAGTNTRRVAAEESPPSSSPSAPSVVPSDVIQSLLLEDTALMERVASGIEEEHSGSPLLGGGGKEGGRSHCYRTRWALGGTGPFLTGEGEHETYELCYDSHFVRVGEPKKSDADRESTTTTTSRRQHQRLASSAPLTDAFDDLVDFDDLSSMEGLHHDDGDDTPAAASSPADNGRRGGGSGRKGHPADAGEGPLPPPAALEKPTEIVLGRRRGSDADAAKATASFLSQLRRSADSDERSERNQHDDAAAPPSSFARYEESNADKPFFNRETGRWELLFSGGDPCVRHVDASTQSAPPPLTMPFSTTVFFSCGQSRRLADASVSTMSTHRRIVINRDIGRCHYYVGVEAAAVCEWEAHLRAATISPILCNRI